MPEQTWPEAPTAGDLTTEHYGLLISWQPNARNDPFDPESSFLPPRRSVVCDELRRWIYKGRRRVEIVDMTPSGAFVGTAHTLDADAPVTVERRIRKARKRPWGKGALKPGEQWAEIEGGDDA